MSKEQSEQEKKELERKLRREIVTDVYLLEVDYYYFRSQGFDDDWVDYND